MDITTIIIGKESNLSVKLSSEIENCEMISSREIRKDIDLLERFKTQNISIIFNNFQPAIKLNEIVNNEEYIVNSIGVTAKIIDYCINNSISINKIIYTSSSSVYGNNILCNENDELKPLNLHASLKVSNEKLIESFCIKNGIDYTVARIFNMYGGDDNFSIISKIIKAYKNNDELTIVNNGNAIRDFIHIDDVVDVYIKLLTIKGLHVLNIGTSNGSSIKNIIDFLHNHNRVLKTKNIYRDELKTSTADNRLLLEKIDKTSFINVNTYIKDELKL